MPSTCHVLSFIIVIYSLDMVQIMRDIQLLWRWRMLNVSIVIICVLSGITEPTEEVFPYIWVPKLVAKCQTSWIYVILCLWVKLGELSPKQFGISASSVGWHYGGRDDESLIFIIISEKLPVCFSGLSLLKVCLRALGILLCSVCQILQPK